MRQYLCAGLLWLLGISLAWSAHGPGERSWVEDPSGQMTLAQAVAAPQQPLTGQYFGQGFSDSAFWIRLRIDPSHWPDAPADKPLVLRLQPVNLDEFQLHDPLSPGGVVRYSGDRHSWMGDGYQSLNSNFVVPLGSEPRDIWLRLKTHTSTFSSIEILDLETARHKDVRQLVWSLVYLSILLICMGWGILSWLSSRDRLIKLYVVREFFMIAYALIILGLWRVLGAQFIAPEWIDKVGNYGFWTVVLVVIWFDIHFLSEFRPHRHLVRLLYVFLAIFTGVYALGVLGHVGLAFRIQAVMLTLCFFAVFVTAASTRIWSEASAQNKPVISKNVLVGFYLFVLLIGVFNRLNAMGIVASPVDIWSMLLLYPLTGSLMMMGVLQLRARQQHKLQQEAQWRVALAERSALEEKSKRQAQQHFLAMLGHELRNPLSAVNFLADSSTPEGQQIRRAVRDMNQVLERSVQAERLDDGGFAPHVEAVDLQALGVELSQRAPPQRLQLRLPEAPVRLQTDRLLLSIVLGNLLDNALKYSPEDSVVTVEGTLMDEAPSGLLQFRVTNAAGPAGMPDADQLFEKYYRNPAAKHQVGSGLGLYLVQGLLHVLGGRIDYRPVLAGERSLVVFEVRLPLQMRSTA